MHRYGNKAVEMQTLEIEGHIIDHVTEFKDNTVLLPEARNRSRISSEFNKQSHRMSKVHTMEEYKYRKSNECMNRQINRQTNNGIRC